MNKEQFLEIKKRAGMTNAQLADFLGVTVKAVEHWLSGRRGITERTSKQMRLLEMHEKLRGNK